MLKQLVVALVLMVISSCGGSTPAGCADPTVRALKLLDSTVTRDGKVDKAKYTSLVADARNKLEAMQKCLPAGELNGEFNEHLRNALISYDEALDVPNWENSPQLKKYWEQARAELGKVE